MDFFALGVPWLIVCGTSVAICYLVVRRDQEAREAKKRQINVEQAQEIIGELEDIWHHVRRNLAAHQATVLRFKERVDDLRTEQTDASLQEISDEAALVLHPTQKINDEICNAYDQIRKQADMLSQLGSKSPTGKKWKLSECTYADIGELLFPDGKPISNPLSVVVFGIRSDTDDDAIDRTRHVERIIKLCVREQDITVRYSDNEFAVFMPEVDLDEACHHADRVQTVVEESLPVSFDAGVAQAKDDEALDSVMERVDAALFSATTGEHGCVYRHTGTQIRLLAQSKERHAGEHGVRSPMGQPLRMTTKKIV